LTDQFKRAALHLDYFRDDKERICQILTWHHPRERRLCIVKYDLGHSYWKSRETGINYKRILKSYSLEGQQDNLELVKKLEPEYLYNSEVYGADFLAVPLERIKKYYYPEDRLQEIFSTKDENLEWLERKVKVIAEVLHDHLKIPFKNMGITGSILWKGQTKKSDIDFMIYGNKYSLQFNDQFPTIYDEFPRITPMDEHKTRRYVESMARKTGLPTSITKKYIAKKSWLSVFDETNLSMLFSPTVNEIPFQYGDEFYTPKEQVEISCRISKADLGSAYPSIYNIRDCTFLGKQANDNSLPIERIMSFEGALTSYFKKDDRIVVRGLLEKAIDKKNNKSFAQIMLGTKECVGNEFILFEKDYQYLKENDKIKPLRRD
jgi:predicted nucleotidyltransferase